MTPRSHAPRGLIPGLFAASLTVSSAQNFNYRSGLTTPTEVTTATN
jgi:uncharacterized membrane protein YjjB (DUF3815 family)